MQPVQACLLEIEALTRETSSDKRRDVLNRVTDLFFLTNDQQSEDETNVFGSAMERVAYELEVEARAALSARIAEIDKAPRQLVRRLANDDIAVAQPVLERSNLLSEQDFIDIAKSKGQGHLKAISSRTSLSAPLTDVIVERGEAEVLTTVTRNQGAQFSSDSLDTLAQKARTNTELLSALGSRADLPADMMLAIKDRVANKLRNEMSGVKDVGGLIDESAANLDLDSFKKSNETIDQLARQNQLTEQNIVELAKARRLSETVHALAALTGLDDRMVSHVLMKAEAAALGVMCKANGFHADTYLALIQTRMGEGGVSSRQVARAMREYEKLSIENAERTLRFLKVRTNIRAGAGSAV